MQKGTQDMTNIITINASYDITTTGTADLSPKTWADVKEWYVRWDFLHVIFEGETEWRQFNLNSEDDDGADFKEPNRVDVFAGDCEFEDELASYSN
jgi:hypothetical protein